MRLSAKLLPAFAVLAMLTATPALAQDDADAQATQQEDITVRGETDQKEEIENPDEVICRRQPPVVGSRLGGRRTCMTRQEWEWRQREVERLYRESGNTRQDRAVPAGRVSEPQ